MRILLFLLYCLLGPGAEAADVKSYFSADYGLATYRTDKLSTLESKPSGSSYSIHAGNRLRYLELGLFYQSYNLAADIIHDGTTNEIQHEGKSYGVEIGIFLNNHLKLRTGYAFHQAKQKLAVAQTGTTMTGIRTNYGLEDEYKNSNFIVGAGLEIFANKRYDLTLAFNHYPMGEGRSSTSALLGFRILIDASVSDFFGQR